MKERANSHSKAMIHPFLEHPDDEALESFLLHRCGEQDLEVLETHLLVCGDCLTRLETLENELADLKAALVMAEEEKLRPEREGASIFRQSWLTLPRLSWAGAACAALVVALAVVPRSLQHNPSFPSSGASQVAAGDLSACSGPGSRDSNLAACRGGETATFPAARPLDLHLDASDVPSGLVDIELVNGTGHETWRGPATVSNEQAQIRVPEITKPGTYFLRLYATEAGATHELLREFRFEVK